MSEDHDHEVVEKGPDPMGQAGNDSSQDKAHEAGAAGQAGPIPGSNQAGPEAQGPEGQSGKEGPAPPVFASEIHLSDYATSDAEAEGPPMYAETDLAEAGSGLHIKVELIRESDRIISAKAELDLTRKARLEIPGDWPDLRQDMPEALWMEIGRQELPYGLEQTLAFSLEQAIKTALEEVLGVELEMGGN
ncbi:MAG: hypothetical protein V1742_02455 [Pseudomonadota bacterium]